MRKVKSEETANAVHFISFGGKTSLFLDETNYIALTTAASSTHTNIPKQFRKTKWNKTQESTSTPEQWFSKINDKLIINKINTMEYPPNHRRHHYCRGHHNRRVSTYLGNASGIARSIASGSCTYSKRNKIITVAIIIGAPSKPKTPPNGRQDDSSLISSVRVTIHFIWTYTTDHENVRNFEMIFWTNSIFTTIKQKCYGKTDYENKLSGTRNMPQEKKEIQ